MVAERVLTWAETSELARELAKRLHRVAQNDRRWPDDALYPIWGIPRGGAYVAAMLHDSGLDVVSDPREARVAVDDIIDSGKTAARVSGEYGLLTYALVEDKPPGEWITFPWEVGGLGTDAADTVTRLLEQIGEDPKRPGLADTPRRVVESWKQIYGGYAEPLPNLKSFDWEPAGGTASVELDAIPFYSTCEHHMLPFFGSVRITYIPDRGVVIGLSKFYRLVAAVANRLQLQERIAATVGDAIVEADIAAHVAVQVEATHLCIDARISGQPSTTTVTWIWNRNGEE